MGTKTIYRVNVRLHSATYHEMPEDAKIIHVGEQGGEVYLWYEFDIYAPLVTRRFGVLPTGCAEVDKDTYVHRGTVIMQSGLVWHVYETVK